MNDIDGGSNSLFGGSDSFHVEADIVHLSDAVQIAVWALLRGGRFQQLARQ